ncbi:MAG: hypothetical protein JW939_01900 [Candidatus Thermoplasmatota archaeon]|nr:hypothetical protein [Candidatus Thermoplasmatota archaeon]
MAASDGSDKYSRIETFLDNADKVREPSSLQEPFLSLWLRIHGEMPTLMSKEDTRSVMSGVSVEQLLDVEIAHSEEFTGHPQEKSSIEMVSPKDVGPTVEMKVEDKRVRFRAAGEDDLAAMKIKEEAAAKVVGIQKDTAPLKGIGGSAARIASMVREMALHYRDGRYDQVIKYADDIGSTIGSDDFKRSVIAEIQGKIRDYEVLGGNMTLSKERFKELTASFKEGKEDFLSLAQATNTLAEEAVKDLVTAEEVVLAEVREPEKPPEKEVQEGPSMAKEAEVTISETGEKKLPGNTETTPQKEEEAEKASVKPVIKIMKKKVVLLKMGDRNGSPEPPEEAPVRSTEDEELPGKKEEEEDFCIDLGEQEEDENDDVPRVDKIMAEQKKADPKPHGTGSKEGPDRSKIDGAFKKIQVVYKASVKLHEQGRDVGKMFDMINMAEDSRKKGDMRMYVGLADQLESMLIGMQKSTG